MQTLVPINTIPQLLTPIKEVVSEPQFVQIERLVRGLLLVEGKRTLEAIRRALAERVSQGSLNHFLAESPWPDADVHAQLWSMLAANPVVAPRQAGLLFADDTLTGEHYGEQIEGLAKYRDVTQPGRAYIYSHCLVNLHYGHELSQRERRQTGQKQGWVEYWLDYRLYRREAELTEHGLAEQFRTKPQLLIDLLRAQDWQRLPAQTIAFDHQYLTPEVVQTITGELQRHWVSKASKSALAWWRGQWVRLDEILPRLPQRKFKAIWVQTTAGRRRYWVYKRRLRLRTLYEGQIELSVVFSKTSRDAQEAVYLVSDQDWSARQIVRVYARRWTIETGHKQEKHLLGIAEYQMTRLKTIQRFWLLNLLAYAVLALLRFVSHPLADELVPEVRTLGQARQFLAVISLLALVSLIIALAKVYSADDIVRRLVKGLEPADLARLDREPPT
jgi:SRSO17 transposase